MKIAVYLLIAWLSIPLAHGSKLKTGLYLSIGQMHYNFNTYSVEANPLIESSDLFLNASLQIPNRWEFNLVYNRTKGKYLIDNQRMVFDKDGLGLELGKIISTKIFTKSSFTVSLDFVGGLYTLIYVYDKTEPEGSLLKEKFKKKGKSQWGFYWTVRLKNSFTNKASLDLGFKSILPVASNEFISSTGNKFLLFKSFLYLGISF